MDILSVHHVEFSGIVNPGAIEPIVETLKPLDYSFQFGKVYLLNSQTGQGGWALSWIVGGIHNPLNGYLMLNDEVCDLATRRANFWCVRDSEIKRFGFGNQAIKTQVRIGLKSSNIPRYFKTEQEIIDKFDLTPQRYVRPLRQLSHEAWNASCAIGVANGKRVFCFPHLRQRFVDENSKLWLTELIKVLKEIEALVLIPTPATEVSVRLCDEVVTITE